MDKLDGRNRRFPFSSLSVSPSVELSVACVAVKAEHNADGSRRKRVWSLCLLSHMSLLQYACIEPVFSDTADIRAFPPALLFLTSLMKTRL